MKASRRWELAQLAAQNTDWVGQATPEEIWLLSEDTSFKGDVEAIRNIQGRAVFARDSDSEIARAWMERLQDVGITVSSEGSLWRYDDMKGIWEIMSKAEAHGSIQSLDGEYCLGSREVKNLKLNAGRVKGIYECALTCEKYYQPNFFRDPPPGIQTANGFMTVSADGAKLKPNSPEFRCRQMVDVWWDPHCEGQPVVDFLNDVFEGDKSAQAKKSVLQEFVGACLLGVITDYEKALVLYGEGANGKSVLLDMLQCIFPKGSVTSVKPGGWGDPRSAVRLRESVVNILSEVPRDSVIDSDTFKAVITGETIEGKNLYRDSFEFRPRCGHMFAANSLFATTDQSRGFWRRFIVLRFNRNFEGASNRNRTELLDELLGCREWLFRWAINGAIRLLKNSRFTEVAEQEETLRKWKREADSAVDYVETVTRRGGDWLPLKVIYPSYVEFCEFTGRKKLSYLALGKRMSSMGVEKKHTKQGRVYGLEILHRRDWTDGEG